jgi:hypothetical protein
MVIVEAGVSAILLVTLDPAAGDGFSVNRILEALIGGASALAVGALPVGATPRCTPAAPARPCSRRSARRSSAPPPGSSTRTPPRPAPGSTTRAIDPLLAEAREVLGGPVLAPPSARRQLERYERSLGQVRSTAVDLVRAAELVAEPGDAALERPTEELLAI